MNKYTYHTIDETVYHDVLPNGLTVYMLPKEGFSKTYVTFSTNLGSLHKEIYNDKEIITLPQGIAHFLEHKLFEQDGVDISYKFALNQASVNAFTSSNKTTYLFSCTDNLLDNISLLLNFVQQPKFTEEGIKKEVGIITQEINMYKDDPNSAIYQGILNNLYKSHPVKNEILGTVESISSITKELLEKTHNTFYHPSNMVLFITGNIDPEEIIKHVKKHQEHYIKEKQYSADSISIASKNIHIKETILEREILVPNLILGVKLPVCNDSKKLLKRELALGVLMDLLIGKSTENYRKLLSEGLINDSFGIDITLSEYYSYFLIGSETNNKELLEKRLKDILLNIKDLEITDELFLKTKKQTIGGFIQSLNSLEYIANNYIKYYYQHTNLLDVLDISKSITKEDIKEIMNEFVDEALYTTCTVIPKKK